MTTEPSTKADRPSRPSTSVKKDTSDVTFQGLDKAVNPAQYEKQKARLEQFDAVVASSRELFAEKNKQYADGIARTGVLGSVVAIAGLSARLEHLVLGANDAGKSQEEVIVDVVKDILNYAAITGIMIMDNNWRPE